MIKRSFNELKKNLKKDFSGLKKIKVAVLADSASQLLTKGIRAIGHDLDYDLEIYEADYDSIQLEILNPGSQYNSFDPNYTLLYFSSQKVLNHFLSQNDVEKENFATIFLDTIRNYVSQIANNNKSKVIVSNLTSIRDIVFYNFGNKTKASWTYQLRKINYELMNLSQEFNNLYINDLESIGNQHGYALVSDSKMYIQASMTYSLDFIPYIAKNTIDIIASIEGKFKKCLILDLDNTTWGGIIGDDGMEGIQVGNLGIGKSFTELQKWAKNLKDRGIILAICSKNTESVAKVPFAEHPEMVLRLDDISVFVANWENKADNIRHIQSILNIGFDSMVFLDDNPFERNLVRSELPKVEVPELPKDPAEYMPYLRTLNLFETASYSKLDGDRTKKYQEEAKRASLKSSYKNIEDFMKSLEMSAEFENWDTFSTPRVAQLTQRSNQFNLRTKRYDESDVKNFIASDKHECIYISLKDKFGDYGIISLINLEKNDSNQLFVDTWIMSCRVLKRGVEKYTLNKIVDRAKALGVEKIVGEYIPTPKNELVRNHYKDLGFIEENELWVLDVNTFKPFEVFIN